jgi:hypothetical protein
MTEPVLNQYLHVHFLGRIVRQIRMAWISFEMESLQTSRYIDNEN